MTDPRGVLSLAVSHAISTNREFLNDTESLVPARFIKRRDIPMFKVNCTAEQFADFETDSQGWWDEEVEVCCLPTCLKAHMTPRDSE